MVKTPRLLWRRSMANPAHHKWSQVWLASDWNIHIWRVNATGSWERQLQRPKSDWGWRGVGTLQTDSPGRTKLAYLFWVWFLDYTWCCFSLSFPLTFSLSSCLNDHSEISARATGTVKWNQQKQKIIMNSLVVWELCFSGT